MSNCRFQDDHPKRAAIHSMLSIMVVCLLMVLSGCGIPGTRRAKPGPTLPGDFRLHNGAARSTAPGLPGFEEMDSEGVSANLGGSGAPETIDTIDSASANKRSTSQVELVSLNRSVATPDLGQEESFNQQADAQSSDSDSADGGVIFPAIESGSGAQSLDATDPSALEPQPDLASVVIESGSQLPVNGFFDDPYLLDLINLALTGNQELRILAEEINIANNEVYARSGEYRPFVGYGTGAGLEKSSRFSRAGAVEDQLEAAPGRGFPDPLPDFLVATGVSWELDIWRKLRNAQCAAALRYLGTAQGRKYVVTRLVAELATEYYELLALDNRLATLQKTIEIQQQSLKVSENMKAAGRATELAVQRFKGEVRKNQSEILVIQQEIVEAENRINFLVGRFPQPIERPSVDFIDLQLNMLTSGLPSDLLLNRADIRAAEQEVAAAGLDVKVARARFYPSLGLNAGVGLNAFNTEYLFSTPESLIYNVALDLVGPLINKRAIKADYCSANAAQLQAIYKYQQTVLTAYIEVVNFLTKIDNYRDSIEIKKQQLAALEASVDAADKLFQSARTEYVEVLLAQREMMEARLDLIEIKREQLTAIVAAYQALGGGADLLMGDLNFVANSASAPAGQ